ncbi:glycoside hydrolase family 3 protein [Actinoplanes sp. NEAU-A12]|uniref:beta-glucosidase n=1 Tax=Actinoplanes sandaracinus TaxID=3045177 RepID=A0ABT6WMA6_9ACTN|nr:glycoside hydrolase family 3 protein [Actinoplanes sandaracinus]MDI6100867.1 glycoside hydrolase family 3 protein [Actinoplanes sandaracinus]
MRPRSRLAALGAVAVLTLAVIPVSAPAAKTISGHPVYLDARQPVERRVADLLSRMTLDDKIGQMTQAERTQVAGEPGRVTEWRLGSVLSGGGSVPSPNTPQAWVDMVNSLQRAALATPLKIPLLYGIDAVHGHGNAHGATLFPHNVGLGATRDPGLVRRVYQATAEEMRATGIPWNFAPCVCVSRDERWGRTYESFSESPGLVAEFGTAIDGLHDGHVLATVKHYAGDGDTENGTGDSGYAIDQGVTVTSRADFARIDLAPYVSAVSRHGVRSVMPSYSSVDWTEDGPGNPVKMHASQELITGTLKEELGFGGFVISDWEGIHQIPDPSGGPEPTAWQVRTGVTAGIDMFMEPTTAREFQQHLKEEVRAGRIPVARIDDAAGRILRVKFQLGLFENPYATLGGIGTAPHRALAREAVAKSQVLLKNDDRLLPLKPDATLYVAGRNADDIGNQAGGWTVDWQGRNGDTVPGATILDGIREVAPGATVTYSADASAPIGASDIGVVVVGETPYAEGFGDVGSPAWSRGSAQQKEPKLLTLQPSDKAVVDKVCDAAAACVVLLVSGRPQVITDQLGEIDALVASWLPGSEGAGVADVLFGRRPFTGRLSMSWPRSVAQVPVNVGDATYQPLYPYGWGLRTDGRGNAVDAAVERAAAGQAPAGWEKLLAEAELAAEAGDTTRADALLRQVSG